MTLRSLYNYGGFPLVLYETTDGVFSMPIAMRINQCRQGDRTYINIDNQIAKVKGFVIAYFIWKYDWK